VKFNVIEIREYDIIVGENPSVTSGPAISIGWNYYKERTTRVLLEEYEAFRGPRRSGAEMVLPVCVRIEILTEHGFTMREIFEAMEDVARAKSRRNMTVTNMKFSKLEEVMESAVRKTKRLIDRRVTNPSA